MPETTDGWDKYSERSDALGPGPVTRTLHTLDDVAEEFGVDLTEEQ